MAKNDRLHTIDDPTPPYNRDAERALIGALIMNPVAILDLSLKAEDLVTFGHSYIYQAIKDLIDRGMDVDYVTIVDELERGGHLEDMGGAAYLTKMIDSCPNALNIKSYAAIVATDAKLRAMWRIVREFGVRILTPGEDKDPEQLRASVVAELLEENEDGGVHTLFDALDGVRAQMQALADGKEIPGIDPILQPLRDIMRFGKIPPGSLCLIGADPGMGKSMLACVLLLGNALLGKRVAYLGTEMPLANLGMRLAPMLANIGPSLDGDAHQFLYDSVDNEALLATSPDKALEAVRHLTVLEKMAEGWIEDRQLIIMDDEHDIDRALLRLRAEETRGGPFDVVVLDMVQGFSRDDETIRTETAMDNAVSSIVTRYGRKTDTVVIAISSFRKRNGGAPTVEDCRGSKQLIHDASFAILLWKDEEAAETSQMRGYGLATDKAPWNGLSMLIGKNSRFGNPKHSGEGNSIPIRIDEDTGLIHPVVLDAPD